ncbi:MFS transporter [Caballeronia sp. LP006]|uniref:MFS transporter n=1 Tax=Caballeronia sp. LP006 TaxID=3038552 RepID=UPI0028610254|nr:MFS transporter [Caballeronia sp. LP006]MDR5832347.1 MFS transporter [Caballeronia sp. LP006]
MKGEMTAGKMPSTVEAESQATSATTDLGTKEAYLLARLERLPFTRWHAKARIVMGSATFFDAFAALSLAYALPVLIGMWHLKASDVGLLIAAGYIGQLIGAIFFGAVAEKKGRVKSATGAIALMAIMGVACGFANGYWALLAFRFLQGIGVGGEVPVAAAYINELSQAHRRGKFFMLYEMIFPIGLMLTGQLAVWLVPALGWQALFLFGAVPTLLISFFVIKLPESPRWLINKGRLDEAESIVQQAEASALRSGTPLEPVAMQRPVVALQAATHAPRQKTRVTEVLSSTFRSRTLIVWGLWASSYFVANGLNNWLPSLYHTVFHLPLADALRTASLTNVLQVVATIICAFAVDSVGRRAWTVGSFVVAGLILAALWLTGSANVWTVIILCSTAYAVIGSTNTLLYLYTPEIYPTRMRAIATALATSWLRGASAAGPALLGVIVQTGGLNSAFIVFATVCAVGGLVGLGMIETRGKRLEQIAS